MNAAAIIQQAKVFGITLSLAPEHQIRYESASPPPPEFVQILRENKPEIIEHLEYADLDRRVRDEGYVLCYAEALKDRVAFHRDDLDLKTIPPGFVRYSLSELDLLFGPDQPDVSIRLVHEAKKLGMKVKDNQPDMGNGTNNK